MTPSSGTRTASVAPIDNLMIMLMIATGVAAAVTVAPALWLVTPVIAMVTFRAAARARQTSAQLDGAPSEFPPRLDAAIEQALAQLPAGNARRLLDDVIREARPLFAARTSAFDAVAENAARRDAGELVLASCETALELARLDTVLDARTSIDQQAVPSWQASNRLAAARELFAGRLADAAAALAALYASGVEHGTPASDRVAELVAHLKAEAGARSAATRELNDLLSSEPPAD